MKYFKAISLIACFAFIISSCQKEGENTELEQSSSTEELLINYPEEITIDNWEEFVYAPNEVLEHFQNKEMELQQIGQRPNSPSTINKRLIKWGYLLGEIQVQGVNVNTSNAFLANTRVEIIGNSITNNISFIDPYMGQNFAVGNITGEMCFYHDDIRDGNYGNDWNNGVTSLDLIMLQRHILGIEVFTHKSQYLAGDVNGSGSLSAVDLLIMQKLILGVRTEFPPMGSNSYNQPVIYIEQDLYDNTQLSNPIGAFPFQLSDYADFSCRSNSDLLTDRYAIKRGDVNGTWNWSSY